MSADFLVEIGTEELPPKSLLQLSNAFRDSITKGLKDSQLGFSNAIAYATPRRLAVLVENLEEEAPAQEVIAWGPPAKIAFDADGSPAKAAEAFARKNGIDLTSLKIENDGKQDKLCHRATKEGAKTSQVAGKVIEEALKQLPIAKRMRWGAKRTEFVRPVQWLVVMHGNQVLSEITLFDLPATQQSFGHRIHSHGVINIPAASDYQQALHDAYVMVDFAERREAIRQQVNDSARDSNGQAVIDDDLLDEVTALNEWPVALAGRFDEAFLEVPPEALISSMKEHQKYFHVVDSASGNLLPVFITIANLQSQDPAQVIAGNERVIRPRLADAAFFYSTDKKTSLENKREKLQKIVFQAKLGTVFEKTERIARLAETLAPFTGADPAQAKRAAELCKSDLVSEMVLEFSDLQGLMGRYYALHDGEAADVAASLFEQYLPRFAGDALPTTAVGTTLALADRIDTLVGIFGIGMIPTGSKDPFALRRASLGVLRLLVEKSIDLDLQDILAQAANLYGDKLEDKDTVAKVLSYSIERFRARYEEDNIPVEVFLSVAAKNLSNPMDIDQRVQAVNQFCSLPEATALAAANKRVSNILAKSKDQTYPEVIAASLEQEEEKALYNQLEQVENLVAPMIQERNYAEALQNMSVLQAPIDAFFDNVMVNAEDEQIRRNRLTLLTRMRSLFLHIADISLLVPEK